MSVMSLLLENIMVIFFFHVASGAKILLEKVKLHKPCFFQYASQMVSSCYFLWVVSFSLNGEKLDLFALQSLSKFSQGDVPQGEQHMLHPVHVTGARGPSQPFNTMRYNSGIFHRP